MLRLRCNNVSRLSTLLESPILLYDLESTGLPQQGEVGITEFAGIALLPNGAVLVYGSLINPERPISADASRITGITQAMVNDKENWGVRYASNIQQLEEAGTYFVGYNNLRFDNNLLREQGNRYGKPCKLDKSFDVRALHLTLLQKSLNSKGKLTEVAQYYGVTPHGDAHRAQADTIMTLEILDVIIEVFGMDAVINYIKVESLKQAAKLAEDPEEVETINVEISKVVNKKNIEAYFRKYPEASLEQCAQFFEKPVDKINFDVSACIDERLVSAVGLRDEELQAKLAAAIQIAPPEVIKEKKLKAWKDFFQLQALFPDYIQIRLALLDANLSWASLKPLKQP